MNEWTSLIVTAGFICVLVTGIFYFWIKKTEIKNDINEISSLIEPTENELNETDTERTENLRERIVKMKTRHTSFAKILLPFTITTIIFLCFVVFVFAQIKVRKDMIIGFDNKIESLKPYIDYKEIDKLNSRWILMKNSKDFDSLNSDVKLLLSNFNLDLK